MVLWTIVEESSSATQAALLESRLLVILEESLGLVILTNAEEDSDVPHCGFLIRRAKHGGDEAFAATGKYTGEYSEHWHGQNTIRQESTGLVISLHQQRCR
jgi:hypothetical protein